MCVSRDYIVYGVSDNVLFVEHSLKKVMDTVSVSCQVRDSVCFCRAMLCIGWPMPSCGVCVSVRLVRGLCQNE